MHNINYHMHVKFHGFFKPGARGPVAHMRLRPTRTWFLEIVSSVNVGVCVCICVRPEDIKNKLCERHA